MKNLNEKKAKSKAISDMHVFFYSIYQTLIPKRLQRKITPLIIKIYVSIVRFCLSFKKWNRIRFVEVRITDHCNLNCMSCSQLSPIASHKYVDVKTFTDDFRKLNELTNGNIKTIKLVGGEPLLHPQLLEFMRIVREFFVSTRIVLVTNGILLLKQNDEFWKTCSDMNVEISISHYPIKIGYEEIQKISKNHDVRLGYATKKPQLMYKYPFDIEGKQDAKKNYRKCYWGGGTCVQIDSGRLYKCHIIPCAKHFNNYFDKNLRVEPEDSIDIHNAENLGAILKFLKSAPHFCRYCRADDVQYGEEWKQSKKEISEWT